MNSEITHINSVPVRIYTSGECSRTLLAIHGFGGSKDSVTINQLAQRLCPEGFRVAAPDLPCHGDRNEPETELTPQRCISDIMLVEDWLSDSFGGEISAFATSFGACCVLRRLELRENRFRRILLRVPAVNMANSLLRCMNLFQPDLTLEQAKNHGFHVKMAKEMNIPYSFYQQLLELNEVRHCESWDIPEIMTIYAGRDELVDRADTEEFLRLNPRIKRLCIEGSSHRMGEYLSAALDSSAAFLSE